MTRIHSRTENRSAFTLIELLVVIAIIAVLVSLTAAGVFSIMNKIPEVQTKTDMSQMDVALGSFMADYNLDVPPPSVLVLNESSPLSSPSAAFLQRVFGKNLGAQGPVDWNGDGQINGPWTLEGEQCLIFYLGGIPNLGAVAGGSPPQCQGFSTNNYNPAIAGGKRKGPYFNFVTSRLVPLTSINPAASSSYFVYLDAWQVKPTSRPYAYFSSYGVNNGYSADCPSIGASPYFTSGGQFTNSNTYQIISAGKNGQFGTTGWNPSGGATGVGSDDQANFSAKILGAGQQ